MTDQVFEYLQGADVFILPSRAEGLSNALLEAMTCGLPVVVSNIPANVNVTEHNKNGLVFTAGDANSLAGAVSLLLEESGLRERLGKAARQTIENRYSLDFIADCYVSLYRDVLSNGQYAPQAHLDLNPTSEKRT
jgi:glycosyltransferase involved in cell wall biosynthesis